ncbi:MAG: hypothetical protein VR69_13260 [Peptococcaceae bacterium BRH_c4b]|nr:MAG: hypothetical protein VR69_13260 [Peptococcaceae bacterium BRH_c4b]
MATKEEWGSYEWKAVAILAVTFGILSFDRWLIAPLFPVIMKDLNLNYQHLGNLNGILAVTWGIASVILGGLSDKFGRRKVIIPAVIGFSIFSAFCGFATAFVGLLIVRALMGFVEGGFTPTAIAATHEASKESRIGLNIGIQQCTFALIGLGLGPIIVTQLLKVVPTWHYVFYFSCIPGLIVAYILYKVIRDPEYIQVQKTEEKQAWSEVFKYRNVILNMLALLGIMSYFFVIAGMIPNYLTDYLKLSIPEMGFVASAVGFGGCVGALGIPAISDRIGRKPAVLIFFIIGIIAVVALINTGRNPGALFVLLFIVAACGFGNLIMNTAIISSESVPATLKASASGIPIGAGEIFGGGIAPVIAGYVANHYGIQYILYIAIIGFVFSAIVSLFLKETAPIKVGQTKALNENEAV